MIETGGYIVLFYPTNGIIRSSKTGSIKIWTFVSIERMTLACPSQVALIDLGFEIIWISGYFLSTFEYFPVNESQVFFNWKDPASFICVIAEALMGD